jgi:hypothetical protein
MNIWGMQCAIFLTRSKYLIGEQSVGKQRGIKISVLVSKSYISFLRNSPALTLNKMNVTQNELWSRGSPSAIRRCVLCGTHTFL